jgi:hypothetical protein
MGIAVVPSTHAYDKKNNDYCNSCSFIFTHLTA